MVSFRLQNAHNPRQRRASDPKFMLLHNLHQRFILSAPLWSFVFALFAGTAMLLPSFLRIVVLIAWLAVASWMVGGVIDARSQARRSLFGAVTIVSLLGLALTLVARFGHLTVTSSSITILLISLIVTMCFDGVLPKFLRFADGLAHASSFPYLLIALFGDTWLLVNFYGAWTAEPLVSPWQLFPPAFFLAYLVTTFAVVMVASLRTDRASLLLSTFHLFVSLSVAVMVFGIGFGFDPFIHRAAEMALVHDGAIEPRRLLYLGQYALVSGTNLLTGVQVMVIDKWLLPTLASLSLSFVSWLGLREGWGCSDKASRVFAHLVLLFPSMFFVFTVPFNLTLLILLIIAFILPLADTLSTKGTLALLGVFALLIHPLGGVPIVFLIGLTWILGMRRPRLRNSLLVVGSLVSALALPALFALYNILNGQPPIAIQPHIVFRFTSLFTDPYFPGEIPIPFFLEWFYDFMRWLPRLLVVLALIFAWRRRAVWKSSPTSTIMLVTALCGSLFLLAGFFSFSDVILYEQLEFASRLLQAMLLLTTPWVLVWLIDLSRRHASRCFGFMTLGVFLASLFMTATWYLSYPQLNLKVRQLGASVSAVDVEVVRFLESRYDGEPFLVLSHQMTSAAAIQETGFRYYLETDDGPALWYAIPTGGKLYAYFLRLSTEGPSPDLIEEIREFANVRHIYFVTYDSWPSAGFIRSRSAVFADASYGVQGTKLVIYEYK